ncbi:hypothetical protein [Streptomyces sp. NPDC005799]|uniref:hypothetical protein n=1 Tax=Streptomyces sp. NPDC005799 TaxID=3154678 RepID=UPI0033CD3E48
MVLGDQPGLVALLDGVIWVVFRTQLLQALRSPERSGAVGEVLVGSWIPAENGLSRRICPVAASFLLAVCAGDREQG